MPYYSLTPDVIEGSLPGILPPSLQAIVKEVTSSLSLQARTGCVDSQKLKEIIGRLLSGELQEKYNQDNHVLRAFEAAWRGVEEALSKYGDRDNTIDSFRKRFADSLGPVSYRPPNIVDQQYIPLTLPKEFDPRTKKFDSVFRLVAAWIHPLTQKSEILGFVIRACKDIRTVSADYTHTIVIDLRGFLHAGAEVMQAVLGKIFLFPTKNVVALYRCYVPTHADMTLFHSLGFSVVRSFWESTIDR